MPHRLLAALVGGLLCALALPALAPAANVTLRIEGTSQTLLPRTALQTDTRTVNKDGVAGHDCTGTSVAGALEIGLAGDWSGTWFAGFGSYTLERVAGETHAFPDPAFYEVRVNNKTLSVGVCAAELQTGDDALVYVARCDVGPPPDFACLNPPVLPLGLTVPSTVAPGVPFSVTVNEYSSTGQPTLEPGATVEGGDAPATTDANGVAVVTVSGSGPVQLRASAPNRARSALETVCATTGADGLCGTTTPSSGAACATNGADGRCGTRDRTAPAIGVEQIADHQHFARGKGPRVLRVKSTPDPSGLLTVKLRLTRNDRGRCTYYSGKSERFRINRSAKCGAANGFWFAVGDREETSYLLPRALPRGHYVLDVNVIDKAYNRDDARRRGSNRVTFDVA